MYFLLHIKISLSILLLTALFSLNTHAGLAGHVILTKGSVSAVAEDGEIRSLKRRSKIMSGEIIKTGAGSSVQIRFIDKALMTIKANSEMDIAEYQLGRSDNDGQEKALMKLVKGGFRTISGQIGKGDKSAYKVDTPAASIGIRGTNYEVQQESNGDFVMAVYSGGISVQNESGSIELGLGGDFNFTRVAPNGAPKGLLVAPETLTENSATDEATEEESEAAETSSEGGDKSDDDSSTEDGDESSDEGASEKTDVADSDSNEEQSTESIASTENSTQSTTEDASGALADKLTEELQENKDIIEEELIIALKAAGILTDGEDLSDLSPTEEFVIGNTGNSDDIIDTANNDGDTLLTAIENTDIPTSSSTDDSTFIQSLYEEISTANNPLNPFPGTYPKDGITYDIISDQEYNLAASEKLGLLVMPMNFNQGATGDLSFNFGQASVGSSTSVNDSSYANSIAAGEKDMQINIRFSILNTSTNLVDEYDIQIPIDIAIIAPIDLLTEINNQLTIGYIDVSKNGASINTYDDGTPYPITDLIASLNSTGSGVSEFKIDSNATAGTFITELDVNFHGTDAALLEELMGGGTDNDNWHSQSDIELMITSGAWESSTDGDGNPIFVMSETKTETINGVVVTLDRNEVVKPNADTVVTDNLFSFAFCGNGGDICSIQVLKDEDNIRWGAWLTEPGKGIQIYKESEESDGTSISNIHEEDKILAFWLAAERADINTLSGDAQFSSSNLNCTDYSQCIGFADDGLVQNFSGSLSLSNYNAATGDGTLSGNLNIEVSDDIGIALSGITKGTAVSTWDVNFSGTMTTGQPEFSTNNIHSDSTVTDSSGTHTNVIGNVGGIFVKPGDIFAGGYNLGTADGSNKHVSGVYTLDKQP